MANYKKTEELFKIGDQMSEERFFEQVKNPITGEFFQLEP